MKRAWHAVGSMRAAALILALVGIAVAAERVWPTLGSTASRSAMLATLVSLTAGLTSHRRARRGALGAFHGGLLLLLVLALLGRTLRFEGRVEVTTGTDFDPGAVVVTRSGPWLTNPLAGVAFRQQDFTVHYAAGLRRGRTESLVELEGGHASIGDDRPLVLEGYRFYTTHNKGYAPLLRWSAPGRDSVVGAVHMPSYPLFDWRQSNTWTAPDGREIRLWLDVQPGPNESREWLLESRNCRCTLIVETNGHRAELAPGAALDLGDGARLELLEVRGWMGYRIFYDPTLGWLLTTALACCAALGWHVRSTRPARATGHAAQSPALPARGAVQ